jgi:hypothetical protein
MYIFIFVYNNRELGDKHMHNGDISEEEEYEEIYEKDISYDAFAEELVCTITYIYIYYSYKYHPIISSL